MTQTMPVLDTEEEEEEEADTCMCDLKGLFWIPGYIIH